MERQTGSGTYTPVPAPRCKTDKHERADYFRIFAGNLLTDEDYENLTREEWGSIFLLMLHQWTKGGTLPEDPKKLAGLARCSREELHDLMEKWPNLKPVEDQPGRVGIPFLVQEMATVMGFYAEQKEKSARAVAARRGSAGDREPRGNPRVTSGEPVGLLNKDLDQEEKEGEGVVSTHSEQPLLTEEKRPAPFSKGDIKRLMGDHYSTYLSLGGMFNSKFKPARDIKILLEILEETSPDQILEAAEIHYESAVRRKNGDVKFMKEFDEWVSFGLHHTKRAP